MQPRHTRRTRTNQISHAVLEALEERRLFAVVGSPIGFGNQATGGAGGPVVTVTDTASFTTYATKTEAYTIQVQGTIDIGDVRVTSNKSILGLGTNATLKGDLGLYGVNNVIVQNLTITNPDGAGEGDGVTIKNGTRDVWIDHNTFVDCADGELDVTRASDFVTMSWNKFYYTANTGHNFTMLVGSSDSATDDLGKLHVTVYNNWWSTLAVERMPSVRFGRAHVFNNYYNTPGNNYGIRSRIAAEVLIENNSFENVDDPYYIYVTDGTMGKIKASGNLFVNTTGQIDDGNDTVFSPPYAYTLDKAADVKAKVTAGAGAGHLGTDSVKPTSAVKALSATTTVNPFPVSWSGSDGGSPASGIANYDVYVSDNNGVFKLLKDHVTTTSASFSGTNGHTYRFYSRARDKAGNLENVPASADATTTLKIAPAPSNWWKLDETNGTSANDSAGGVKGSLLNTESTDWMSGKNGGGLALDGVNESINLGNTLNVTKNFTISAWIKPAKVTGIQGIFGKATDVSNKQFLLTLNNNRLNFQYERGGNNWYIEGGTIQANVWQHVVVTVDNSLKVTLYINNATVASGFAPAQTLASNAGVTIGRWGGTYNNRFFAGVLDDVKFYATALDAPAVALT